MAAISYRENDPGPFEGPLETLTSIES